MSPEGVSTPARQSDKTAPRREPDPASPTNAPADLGNQMLQALAGGGLRAKLEVGGADDPEERAADRLADQVLAGRTVTPCSCGGGCASCGGPPKVRRQADGRAAASGAPVSIFGNRSGRPLDPGSRRRLEPRFGADFGAVRVHDDPATHRVARGIGARAFAIGSDIGFAEGRHRPGSLDGDRLLAHELAHVALGHGGTRRMMIDGIRDDHGESAAWLKEIEEAQKRHEAWSASVDKKAPSDLKAQSSDIGEERERIGFAVIGQRAAVLDAASGGEGWLNAALLEQGYSGPSLATVREAWAGALLAAEGLSATLNDSNGSARLAALETVPQFYGQLAAFAAAVELAEKSRHDQAVAVARAEYQRKSAEYEHILAMDQISMEADAGGDGGAGFSFGLALARGAPPTMPVIPAPPEPISGTIADSRARILSADSATEWLQVTQDVRRLGDGLARLVAWTLPVDSDSRASLEYLEKLEGDLAKFEQARPLSWRVPATFYPLDQIVHKKDADGNPIETPKSIPWQLYLTNTGVTSYDRPATSGGQWVLTDLTSGRIFTNRADTSDFDLARLQQGEAIDPPFSLFEELNDSLRFPKGRLHLQMPSGALKVVETTEPITLHDFLEGLGLALLAVVIVAGIAATGGVAGAGAVAFYAGVGGTLVGIGTDLASLREKEKHGILTQDDVDKAMISIGINVASLMSMGLGRIVNAPGSAARYGSRYILLSATQKAFAVAAGAGDVYQALAVTRQFVDAFAALDKLPPAERDKARTHLILGALLTGTMMTVSIKSDLGEIFGPGGVKMGHLDEGGAAPHARAEGEGAQVHAGAESATPSVHAVGGPHVAPAVHESSQRAGADISIGTEHHAVAAVGTGQRRDFYFCSDMCGPIVDKLRAAIKALPRDHPELEMFNAVLSKVNAGRRKLRAGKLSQEEADALAAEVSADVARLSRESRHFGPLMNTDTAVLQTRRREIRKRLADDLEMASGLLDQPAARQGQSREAKRPSRLDEPDSRSDMEEDLMSGFDMKIVDRASPRAQKLNFDAGNFAHSHAKALVDGFPPGAVQEVPILLINGKYGRADGVEYIVENGDVVGAIVYEVKPNKPGQIAKGHEQARAYADGLQLQLDEALREAGKPVPATLADGSPRFRTEVLPYDQQRMMSVLRAIRSNPRDRKRMAELEEIVRQVFEGE